jgi:hypothetical protein
MLLLKAKKANFKIPCKLQHSQKIKKDKKFLKNISSIWISKAPTIFKNQQTHKNPETKNNNVTNSDISFFLSKNKTTDFTKTPTDQLPIELIKFDPTIIKAGKKRKIIKSKWAKREKKKPE